MGIYGLSTILHLAMILFATIIITALPHLVPNDRFMPPSNLENLVIRMCAILLVFVFIAHYYYFGSIL